MDYTKTYDLMCATMGDDLNAGKLRLPFETVLDMLKKYPCYKNGAFDCFTSDLNNFVLMSPRDNFEGFPELMLAFLMFQLKGIKWDNRTKSWIL